ncbi:hypothetical protein [Flagellimonas sp.]|uniref:hypothetical protein n=1 Tax=Flagellimonas sp. TaxID=2058762 RepID=UPI003F4A793C
MGKILKFICIALFMASWGCEDILEVPDISNQSVPILAPSDGSVLNNNRVRFSWDAIEEATAYRIQVANPNFEQANQILLDSVIQEDTLGNVINQIDQTLPNGNYAWRIKAMNSGFETPFSNSGFAVDAEEDLDLIPPEVPTLIAPENGSVQNENEVDFSWTRNDIPGTAERDSIFIFLDEELQNLSTKAIGANKSFSISLEAGTFYWVVHAYDAAGNQSQPSSTFSFTIEN